MKEPGCEISSFRRKTIVGREIVNVQKYLNIFF